MKHIIVSTDGTGRTAICGQRMPRSRPTGHEFYYRFGEADLSERGIPDGLDCPTCRAVAEKVKLGVLLSYAIREARSCQIH